MAFNINNKRLYYYIAIIIGIVSVIITLNILTPKNKTLNKVTVQNSIRYYAEKISQYNKDLFSYKDIKDYYYPFKIKKTSTSDKKFDLTYNQKTNELTLQNFDYLNDENKEIIIDIVKNFGLHHNISTHLNLTKLSNVYPKLPFYRNLNLFFLVDINENLTDYRYCLSNIKPYAESIKKSELKVIMKYIFYNKTSGLLDNKNIYRDIKQYNPGSIFDELNDMDNLNLLIYDDKNAKKESYFYNDDLNAMIITIDSKKELKKEKLQKIISLLQMKYFIPLKNIDLLNKSIFNNNIIKELMKFSNSLNIQYHNLLITAINGISKINRIFPLYESILTINEVTNKLNNINWILNKIMKSKYDLKEIDYVTKLYVDTQYLLDSNELVVFEHFFSNEFKIGQFLPIMMPIFYGFIKTFKGIRNSKKGLFLDNYVKA